MGLLSNLFEKQGNNSSTAPEQAVIVHFEACSPYQSRLFALEDRLEKVIASTGTGELDGNEIATDGSDGYLYMYGPDADALFMAVRPTLDAVDFMKGARVMLRYGPPEEGVEQVEIVLGT
jgi:hypothetical protein